MKIWSVTLLLLCFSFALRAEEQPLFEPTPPLLDPRVLSAFVGMNVSTLKNSGYTSLSSFTAGVAADYFPFPLSNRVAAGVFGRASVMKRGYRQANQSGEALFADLDFGLNLSARRNMDRNSMRLGGFLAVPFSDYSGTLATAASRAYAGLCFSVAYWYGLSEDIGLGIDFHLKVGMTSALASTDNKFTDLGLSLSLSLF